MKYLINIVFLFYSVALLSQQSNNIIIEYSNPAASLQVCQGGEIFSITVRNVSAGTITNIVLRDTMPIGVRYVAGSLSGSGVSFLANPASNIVSFNIGTLLSGSAATFTYKAQADCQALSLTDSLRKNIYRAEWGTNYNRTVTSFYNLLTPPSLSVLITNNQSYSGIRSTSFSRTLRITNGGATPLSNFYLMDINSVDISITGVSAGIMTVSGDTNRVYFAATEIATVGDGDTLLEQNEYITITETVRIVGCTSLNSTISAYWGCLGATCMMSSSTVGNVSLASGTPNFTITSSNNLEPSLCTTGYRNVVIKNTGTQSMAGAGGAFNTIIQIGSSWTTYFNVPRRYTDAVLDSFKINGVSITPILGTSAQGYRIFLDSLGFTSDPDGIGGISDLNGDGKFAEIAAGDSLRVYFSIRLVPTSVTTACARRLVEYQYTSINITFNDMCGIAKTPVFTPSGFGASIYLNSNYNPTSFTMPADIIEGQAFTFSLFTPHSFNFRACTDSIYLKLVVPSGISIAAVPNAFINTVAITPFKIADTIFLPYAAFVGDVTWKIDLVLACPPGGLSTNIINYEEFWECWSAGAACSRQRMHCGSVTLGTVHCGTLSCKGATTTGFSVLRTSFGTVSETNATPVSASTAGVRADRAFLCDTIQMKVKGVVVDTNYNNMYIRVRYTLNGTTNIFSFLNGIVHIHDLDGEYGGVQNYYFTANTPSVTHLGSNVFEMLFNLSNYDDSVSVAAGRPIGTYLFGKGASIGAYSRDSINLTVNMRFVAGGGIVAARFDIPNFRATHYALNGATEVSCDNWGANFGVEAPILNNGWGMSYYTSSPIIGCNEFTLGYSNAYGGVVGDPFPNEYRPIASMDSVIFELPAGFSFMPNTATVYNVPTTVNVTPIIDATKTRAFFDGALFGIPEDKQTNTYAGGSLVYQATIKAIASCNVAAGNYTMRRKAYFKTSIYSPACQTSGSHIDNYTFTYQPISVGLTPINQTVIASSDTIVWNVRLDNPSNLYPIDSNWIAVESGTGGATVIRAEDVSSGSPIALPLSTYAAGQWVKIGLLNAQQSKTIKLYATYTSCTKDSVRIKSGFDCGQYPSPFSTSCTKDAEWLYFIPQNGELQSVATNHNPTSDLCVEDTLSVRVINTQTGAIKGLKVRFTMPNGMSYIAGTSNLLWPEIGGSYTSIGDPTNLGNGVYEYVITNAVNPYLNAYGLPSIASPDSNSFKIKLRATTDCNYTSGSSVSVRTIGNLLCGTAANSITSQPSPMTINGLGALPYYSLVDITVPNNIDATATSGSKIRIKIKNLGGGATSSSDHFYLTAPANYTYEGNFVGLRNPPPTSTPSVSTVLGMTRFDWTLPNGVPMGDSIYFECNIKPPSNTACNSISISGQSLTASGLALCGAVTCALPRETGSKSTNTVSFIPAFINDATTNICKNELTNLTTLITSYNTYLNPVWRLGSTTGTLITTPTNVTPSVSGQYYLVAENPTYANCKDTATVSVNVRTLIVGNSNATGEGSLGQAILCANSSIGLDTIRFNISAADISLQNPDGIAGNGDEFFHLFLNSDNLITITDSLVIDGLSQSGSNCNMSVYAPAFSNNTGGKPKGLKIVMSGGYSSEQGININGNTEYLVLKGIAFTNWRTATATGTGKVKLIPSNSNNKIILECTFITSGR